MNEVEQIECQIAILPKGSITKKVIQGKDRYYLQWREGGKVKNRYVSSAELPELSAQIAQRKELQQKLIELQVSSIQQSLVGVPASEALMGVAAEARAAYTVAPYDSQDRLVCFLLSMGMGFCLEARAKSLSVEGTDLRVDWVFYNRLLHCHVLINLKDGEFKKSNLDQLASCVAHYSDCEKRLGDNPPVGILLSTLRGPKMVEYVSTGIPKSVFAASYKPVLPAKHQLLDFMEKCDLLQGVGVI